MQGKLIGIDPGLTATGIVIGRQENNNLKILKHAVFGAEGENWYEKCDDLASRIKTWIINNTNEYDLLYIMVEEPVNMQQNRAWSAALQNRLLSSIIHEVSDVGLTGRTVKVQTIIPLTAKKIFTNNGHASKDDMIDKASKMYKFRIHWNKRIKEAVADAIGICYCCWIFTSSGMDKRVGVTRL